MELAMYLEEFARVELKDDGGGGGALFIADDASGEGCEGMVGGDFSPDSEGDSIEDGTLAASIGCVDGVEFAVELFEVNPRGLIRVAGDVIPCDVFNAEGCVMC